MVPVLYPSLPFIHAMSSDSHAILTSIIQSRKTEKILRDPDAAPYIPEDIVRQLAESIHEDLITAGWAPFHYPREVDGMAEPWRAHVLGPAESRRAAFYLRDELGLTSKEPLLAGGCASLVLITWLPENRDGDSVSDLVAEKRAERDREHLAASSAMVQNFLLLLTARGLGTYWSSGGAFGGPEMFRFLGIPPEQELLAAVFVEHPDTLSGSEERKPGAQRERRSGTWIRIVQDL